MAERACVRSVTTLVGCLRASICTNDARPHLSSSFCHRHRLRNATNRQETTNLYIREDLPEVQSILSIGENIMSMRNGNAVVKKVPTHFNYAADLSRRLDSVETSVQPYEVTDDEVRVASMGIEPGKLKPIKWINDAHHADLVSRHAISAELQEQIAAYSRVAERGIGS